VDRFACLPPEDRKPFIGETAAQLGVADSIVEKDFWVCWTLKHLFGLHELHRLLFRGGTSLSKAYGLIKRFSEDIDITIHREDLGICESRSQLRDMSRNARGRWLESLKRACEAYIAAELLPSVLEEFHSILDESVHPWTLAVDPDEPQTLLFEYPDANLPGDDHYLQETIRIAFGARGELQPCGSKEISPYVGQQFQDAFEEPACQLMTLAAERTFWEKVTALHGWHHGNNPQKAERRSRHYYDVCMLSRSEVIEQALEQLDLLADVAEHKSLLFHSSWAHYDEAVPGTLRLVPQAELRSALKSDYGSMRVMFFQDPPPFEEILTELEDLEARINDL
jgi:predicted nucleotidyltransferase component of viral defense system